MPSENDLEFDLFLEAFEAYREAKQSHDKALGRYSGYSWGYHGASEIDALNEARSKLKSRLQEIIKAEVRAALEQHES